MIQCVSTAMQQSPLTSDDLPGGGREQSRQQFAPLAPDRIHCGISRQPFFGTIRSADVVVVVVVVFSH